MTEILGEFIREIREGKNFSQRAAVDSQLSASMVSKFENGQADLSISHFMLLMNQLGVSFRELNGYLVENDETNFEYQLDKIGEAFMAKNVRYLMQMRDQLARYHNNQEKHLYWITILTVERLQKEPYSQNVVTKLLDDLLKRGEWTSYEALIFTNVMFAFKSEQVAFVMPEVLELMSKKHSTLTGNNGYVHLLNNAVVFYLEQKNVIVAQRYLGKLRELRGSEYAENAISLRLQIKYLSGLVEIANDNLVQGIRDVEEVIQLYTEVGMTNRAEQKQMYLANFVALYK